MSRGLSTAIVNALKADVVRPVTFARLDFSSSTLYLHDSIGTFTWCTIVSAHSLGVVMTG